MLCLVIIMDIGVRDVEMSGNVKIADAVVTVANEQVARDISDTPDEQLCRAHIVLFCLSAMLSWSSFSDASFQSRR